MFLGMGWLGEQMNDDFGIGCALENMAVLFVLAAKEAGVDEVAVVGDGDGAEEEFAQERLSVTEFA